MIGFGRIAPRHLEVFRALNCDVVACCNRSQGGRQSAQAAGISAVYADIEEMLVREQPDGVICCPSFDRVFEVATKVIPHGIPILLEKPPATSLDEFNRLRDLVAQYGTNVVVGLNRRHYSVLQKALDDAGGVDRITTVHVEWSEDPIYLLKDRRWSHDQVSRTIFANSLHGLDLLTFLSGPLFNPHVEVIDRGDPFRWTMSIHGISTRSVLASFHSTWDSPGAWRVFFCVSGKRYTFSPLENCIMMERGTRETRPLEPADYDQRFKPGFYGQAKAFLDTVTSGRGQPELNLDSVTPAMLLSETLTQAFQKGSKTSIATQPVSRVMANQ